MPRKFYCKMQIEWICNRILSQQKNVECDNFFCDRTNVGSKLLLLGHLPNLVGHCPMSDSNLQPCLTQSQYTSPGALSINTARPVRTVTLLNGTQYIWTSGQSNPKFSIKFWWRSIFARFARSLQNQIFPLIQREKFWSDRSGHGKRSRYPAL
jgi:hypothetical protein